MGLEGRRATRRPFAILLSNPTIDTTGCSVQRRYVVSYTERIPWVLLGRSLASLTARLADISTADRSP